MVENGSGSFFNQCPEEKKETRRQMILDLIFDDLDAISFQ